MRRLNCRVRLATLLDQEGVLALMNAGERRTLDRYFAKPSDGSSLWVAEGEDGLLLGAAFGESLWDYFTEETHGHLGILVVAQHAARRGVGRMLIEHVEAWAREKGFRFLTLNVFARNHDARRFYERGGFLEDTVRYVKSL